MLANGELETTEVIWDLDGTILNSFDIFAGILNKILSPYDFDIPEKQVLAANYHGILTESIQSALGGNIPEATMDMLLADFLRVQNDYYDNVDQQLFPDAIDLVKRLHAADVFQILVTNRFHKGRLSASPRNIVRRSSLNKKIDVVLCGDDGPYRKPDSRVIDHYIQSGIMSGEHTVVIGDQFVDAEFARNLGAKAILVSRDGSPIPHIDKLGDYKSDITVVKSLDQVIV